MSEGTIKVKGRKVLRVNIDGKSTRSVLNCQCILGTSFLFLYVFSSFTCVSCAEVSSVFGQTASFSSETGAAHPDGPPSQPHVVHRSQVTNGNRLQLCVTVVPALISFRFYLMPQLPSAVTLQKTFSACCGAEAFNHVVSSESCSFTLVLYSMYGKQ